MTGFFSSLPQGSKDYLTCLVLIVIGIIFYYLGQMGIAMVFFSIGIVLFVFFSNTYSFHMWRERGDDDAGDDNNEDYDDIDDDIIDDENNGGSDDEWENNDDKE
ncbi:MAG: hypothetical protein WC379_12510 [Methanoregula sp.]|jgi:hypothetical protein